MTDQNKPEPAESPDDAHSGEETPKAPDETGQETTEPTGAFIDSTAPNPVDGSAETPPDEPVSASVRSTVPPAEPAAAGGEEIPYIDDPVSKWWIAIIIAVFALIFAYAILLGQGGLLEGIFSNDGDASPEPTLVASPSSSAEASTAPISASVEPTAAPTVEATPQPTATTAPTPPPTARPTPSPSPTATLTPPPTPEPTAEPTPEPTAEPTPPPTPSPAPTMTPGPTASLGPCASGDPVISAAPSPGEPSATPCLTPNPSVAP